MAKPAGRAVVYIVGKHDGPIKVGITARRPATRLQAARLEVGDPSLELHETWETSDAIYVEKFVHIYLQEFHIGGEWFDVSSDDARDAVLLTIRLLAATTVRPIRHPTWFEMVGISQSEAEAYLESRPRSGIPLLNGSQNPRR